MCGEVVMSFVMEMMVGFLMASRRCFWGALRKFMVVAGWGEEGYAR